MGFSNKVNHGTKVEGNSYKNITQMLTQILFMCGKNFEMNKYVESIFFCYSQI